MSGLTGVPQLRTLNSSAPPAKVQARRRVPQVTTAGASQMPKEATDRCVLLKSDLHTFSLTTNHLPVSCNHKQYRIMASNWALELNGDEDEDAALRRAIAMSLGEAVDDKPNGGASRHNDVASIQAQEQEKELQNVPATEPAPTDSTTSSMAALGLDRKKMEEERLARLRKRKAESISNDGNTPAYHVSEPPSQRPRLAIQQTQSGHVSAPDKKPKPSSAAHLPYAKGTVLRTYVRGIPRDRDITIEEVFQKDELELAVLSSFQWDEDWLMTKLNFRKTKVMMIAFAADEAQVRR